MKRKILIAVVGSEKHVNKKHLKTAEKVGKEIARRGGVVLCGGRAGVMDAVAKGCKSENGLVIGILPESDRSNVSKFVDIPILTGMGFARNQIIGFSCDAMIAIGGGVGTLTEMAYAYAYSKPIVAIEGMGGWPEKFIGKYMDRKKRVKVVRAKNAKEAVDLAFKLVKK
jgi:hypothetical protein